MPYDICLFDLENYIIKKLNVKNLEYEMKFKN